MPQRLKQKELQGKRTNQNTGLEEVQDNSKFVNFNNCKTKTVFEFSRHF